jgi:hypothetical protein
LALASATFATAPVAARGKDGLAACMWAKMPTSTSAFVDNTDGNREFSLFLKAAAPCGDDMSARLDLNRIRKDLIKLRPAVIAADSEISDQATVCPVGPDGRPQGCKPAGE